MSNVKVKWYVDQKISGRTVSTSFDEEAAAEAFAKAVKGRMRKPLEANGVFSGKLFEALKK